MVRRIIVRARTDTATGVKDPASASATTSTRFASPSALIAPLFLTIGFHYFGFYEFIWSSSSIDRLVSLIEEVSGVENELLPQILVVAFGCVVLVSALHYVGAMGMTDSDGAGNKGVAIMLYHVGVQLAIVTLRQGCESVLQQGKPRFIPRDQIVDCIVTEVILAHKIQNVVVLRLRHERKLVNAFPGVDLTYTECCALRSEINSYLTLR